MIQLDNTQHLLASLGGDAVLASVQRFPDQIMGALRGVLQLNYPADYVNVKNIVFCGMGGSRFPGLIVYYLYKPQFRVPFEVCDDYTLPGSVNEHTLVVLSSYSGTTEEVLSCAQSAKDKGAKIVGFSVGGPLKEWLQINNYPFYQFNPDHNPSGQPRMGFGYTAGSFLGILVGLGLLSDVSSKEHFVANIEKEMDGALTTTKMFDVSTPETENPAKLLAVRLKDRYPYLLLSEHLTGVGNCFQNQINETSKNISSYRIIPEINHHLMESLQFPEAHRSMALFVSLFSELYSERIKKRFVITEDVVKKNGIEVYRHTILSTTKLAQVVELSMFGSYVTMYLAGLYGVDPTKIPFVDYFKAELKK